MYANPASHKKVSLQLFFQTSAPILLPASSIVTIVPIDTYSSITTGRQKKDYKFSAVVSLTINMTQAGKFMPIKNPVQWEYKVHWNGGRTTSDIPPDAGM